MLLNLVRAWWQAVARPATETFRRLASKRSHVKALTGVLFAAVLGLRISWIIHQFPGASRRSRRLRATRLG
jgi:hypothetical protein